MERLDLAIRTLFQEFQETVLQRARLENSLAPEPTFTKKTIKGKTYWYTQHYEKGQAIQHYFGPADTENNLLIETKRKERQEKQSLLREMIQVERRRAVMLKRGGLPSLDSQTSQVMEHLAHLKLIHERGVLIGTYAFASYVGTLGCLFEKPSLRTLDIDVVRETDIQTVVGKKIELPKSFRPVPSLSPKALPSSFVSPQGIRIDLLTPLCGKNRGILLAPDMIQTGLQPLHFLDFLIKASVESVLIGPKGGIPVTVPHPARFAIHKLITAAYRSATEAGKKKKDLIQAAQLIEVCTQEMPDELKSSYQEARQRGKKWKKAIEKTCSQLPENVQALLKKQ